MSNFVEEEKVILEEYKDKIQNLINQLQDSKEKEELNGYFNNFVSELKQNTTIINKPFND